MKKKVYIISSIAAVLLVLASLSSVVGSNVVRSDVEQKIGESPLFSVRMKQSLDSKQSKITTNYVGKGQMLNIFSSRKTSLDGYVDQALKMINARPVMFEKILDKLENIPAVIETLEENDVSIEDFRGQINLIRDNPDLLKEKIGEIVQSSPLGDDPLPLGLSTSSAIGCFIIVLVMLPIIALIGGIIATMTIITCLNLGGCFETLVGGMLESFIQGLTPP